MTGSTIGTGIAKRLIIFIVLFSSLITLLATVVQLYLDYETELDGLERSFTQIEASYLQSISATVWLLDQPRLDLLLDGVQQLTDIVRVQVSTPEGVSLATRGVLVKDNILTRTFELTYRHRDQDLSIGWLTVDASLDVIYQRLRDRVLIILASNAVKTFLVAAFIFVLFSHLVTRHLGAMADYARRLRPGHLDETLTLDRTASRRADVGERPDELETLASALNDMRERLGSSYRAIEESEERFRQLAENIREVFWILSPDWQRVFYVSPAYEDVWGHPASDAHGNWLDSVHEDDRRKIGDVVTEKIETACADPSFPEFRIVRPDGDVRWIRTRAFPVFDADGVVVRIVGVTEDITQRRAREQAQRENERLYRSIVETTAEGYWLVDEDGMTLEVNDSLCRILGVTRDDILGTSPRDFIAPTALQAFDSYFNRRKDGEHRAYVTTYLARDGSDVHAQVSASSLYDGDGTLIGSFAFVTDITEKHQAEEELKRLHENLERRVEERTRDLMVARNQAVAADRAKSEFLANMSHELRTPLNAVIGFSDVMIQEVFGAVENPRYQEYVKLINESGTHLLELISDLLDVSAIEAGRMDMHEEETIVEDVVNSCLRLINERANKACVSLDKDLSPDVPMVIADARRLKQILINLLTNAVKFTPEGGHVSIITTPDDDGGFWFQVKDTGSGISEEDLEQVLLPFARTQSATEGHIEGTGLGLPLVKGLVESHGGRLELSSVLGSGTTASVYLPPEKVPPAT